MKHVPGAGSIASLVELQSSGLPMHYGCIKFIYFSMYLFIYLFFYSFIYLFIYLSSRYLPVCPFFRRCPSDVGARGGRPGGPAGRGSLSVSGACAEAPGRGTGGSPPDWSARYCPNVQRRQDGRGRGRREPARCETPWF